MPLFDPPKNSLRGNGAEMTGSCGTTAGPDLEPPMKFRPSLATTPYSSNPEAETIKARITNRIFFRFR